MLKSLNDQRMHEWNLMRHNAYLISVYSDLEGKARKKLRPEKMLPLETDKKKTTISHDEKWKLHRLMRRMNRDGFLS